MTITQQYRRRQSRPATLLNIHRNEVANQEVEEREEEETQGHDVGPSEPTEEEVEETSNQNNEWGTPHLTRLGVPDRRFLENRALTEEDVGLTFKQRRANSGMVINGIHVTADGAPDRRYKENRALTDEDIEILKAELILQKHGVKKEEISPMAILARHAANAPTQKMPAQQPVTESGTRPKVTVRRPSVQQKAAAGGRRR